jgi:hypothetical protein
MGTDGAAWRTRSRCSSRLPARLEPRGHLLAGVTVAAYLVPQVMAYAGVAELAPVAEPWAILPALALYARCWVLTPALGRPRVDHRADDGHRRRRPGRYATLSATLAVTVGLLCLVVRVVRA